MVTDSPMLALHPLLSDPDSRAAVDSALDQLLEAIGRAQADLNGPRGPRPELVESSQTTIDQFAQVRGRGLALPLLGTGLGRGALVALTDGSVKYDFITGIGVHAFGHGDLDLIRESLIAGLSGDVMQGNLQANEEAAAFARTMLRATDSETCGLAHCFLTNSGALANENALKVCMQKTQAAPRVLAFEHCFAGRTTAMAQIGDSAAGRQGVALNLDVDYLPFFEAADPEGSLRRTMTALNEVLRRYPGQHACFVMELLQGEGGFNPAPAEFFRPLLVRAREAGLPIWFDEIQTFGRTEAMFRYQLLGLDDLVDVVTVGKMSQVCATLYTEDFNPRPGLLSATFIGSTAALRVGRRIIERLRDSDAFGPDGRHARLHNTFLALCEGLRERHPACFPAMDNPDRTARLGEIAGGAGGMMRLTPYGGDGTAMKALVRRLFDAGVIAFSCGHGPFHLRFLPPVGVLTDDDLAAVMAIVGDVLEVDR
jgi:acetylornithine aminotransferase